MQVFAAFVTAFTDLHHSEKNVDEFKSRKALSEHKLNVSVGSHSTRSEVLHVSFFQHGSGRGCVESLALYTGARKAFALTSPAG